MDELIDFISNLIYGNVITPNHRMWVQSHAVPANNTDWVSHHVDVLLPPMQSWLSARNQPPLLPWDGTAISPWPGAAGVTSLPLPASLDGSFAGITTEAQLSQAIHQRLVALGLGSASGAATELASAEKAPFSHRYWGYVTWASLLRRKFRGEIVVPPAAIVDRDGTNLSALAFLDVFNELHWRWHDFVGGHGFPAALFPEPTPQATQNTPKLSSPAGQRAYAIGAGNNSQIGSEFFRFHRDHIEIYNRWLQRNGLPSVKGYLMTTAAAGAWPSQPNQPPATWVQANIPPWVTSDDLVTNINALRTSASSLNQMGLDASTVHANGHNANLDIGHPRHNNYVTRFYSWHEWIDEQWYFRAPRFGRWDATSKARVRIFDPVLSTGAAWPGLHAISIARDPASGVDAIVPENAVAGSDFTSGAGTLKMQLRVNDSYNRDIRVTLRADVFNDAVSANVPVETLALPAFVVGPGAGAVAPLDTDFSVDFAFAQAFRSDSPVFSAAAAVGFVNSRITITGTLADAAGTDTFAATTDVAEILLVKEKQAPQVDLYFNQSSFGEGQVASAMTSTGASFPGALIVTVQDRTSDDAPITWPAPVDAAVKGLIKGPVPGAGLFDDAVHAPVITLGLAGISAELASGPHKEDAALPDHLPQRYTYVYDIRFQNGFAGFNSIPVGSFQNVPLSVNAGDRSNNRQTTSGAVRLLRDANPYMIDGSPAWLSIDTRVFRAFEGDTRFNATLAAAPVGGVPAPNAFIQSVIGNLRANNTGGDTFDGLPTAAEQSALVFFPSLTNIATGTTRKVFNFALARVRLQGVAGAADVRAFFRLFRYTASNLIFNPSTSYRSHVQPGAGKVPLMGFDSAVPGGNAISVPFFSAARVNYDVGMTTQSDPMNVASFPAGAPGEQVIYFGAYLDINQDAANSRLPLTYVSAAAEQNGFSAGQVASLRNIFYDSHVCMAVEINHDSDPTQPGDDPFNSDNLAQRNLVVLKSDNPGGMITHQVQHSFEVFTGDRFKQLKQDIRQPQGAENTLQTPLLADGGFNPVFITAERYSEMWGIAAGLHAFRSHGHHAGEESVGRHHFDAVERDVQQSFPFVMDGANWKDRNDLFDELMILWHDLPREARASLYLPGINCEHLINLRNMRHAPRDVRIRDTHTVEMVVGGVTYIPLPAAQSARIPGIMTIDLPDNVRKGQRWVVDVLQLRGEERRTVGAFQLVVEVSQAKLIAREEREMLQLMFERLSLLPAAHPWRPVLEARVSQLRARAKELAVSAGEGQWLDPTTWHEPGDEKRERPRPLAGRKIVVVLEAIRVLDDLDPLIKGKGEFCFASKVFCPDNGGQLQAHRLPSDGVFQISDKPGHNELRLEKVIFSGFVQTGLRIEITGIERDTFDPDDVLGKYTRIFSGDPDTWYGSYGPGDETPIDPENMLSWELRYRIERP
jgi:hypothetical protein